MELVTDKMVSDYKRIPGLAAFLENFCANGQPPHRTPESSGLARTAQVQLGVYVTFEAPFVRILGLYRNCLEDPGVISDQDGALEKTPNDSVTIDSATRKNVAYTVSERTPGTSRSAKAAAV
jgi:hypothetical protein